MHICYTSATKGIILNNPLLGAALGVRITYKDASAQAVIAWGQKPSRTKAVNFAILHNLPLVTVEDGFLRSLDSGTKSIGASFITDDEGVYFDLTTPNRLQRLISECIISWDENKESDASALIDKITTYKLSKYNHSDTAPVLSTLANNNKPHVIIIDQVAGDASLGGAGAKFEDVEAMVREARHAYPNANIWLKAHPAGAGHFDYHKEFDGSRFYLTTPCNPIALLAQAEAVYTVSSHMGFEALMLGKKVHCFGVSWYAGFGLTDDTYIQNKPLYAQVKAHHQSLGMTHASLSQLFYASYINYSHYANPATGQACDIDTVMDYLITNRDWQSRLTGNLLAYEFSRWKVPFVRGFLGFGKTALIFKAKTKWRLLLSDAINAKRIQRDDDKWLKPTLDTHDYVTWGQQSKQVLKRKLEGYGLMNPVIWCMEDGFIRSNGLGATLIAPLSVVMDDAGIYFDATSPSRLEQILSTICLTTEQKQRAKALHELLLNKRVSKYNVPTHNHNFSHQITQLKAENRPIHLVVGQVEDDASVRLCTSSITKNSDLLAKVRANHPHDILIYKPHPDVELGLRVGKADNHHLADVVACEVAMPDCLDACDVVHTISSLTGFEALLRGKSVVCYGLPFYAGFGLTSDVVEEDNLPKQQAINRRKRQDLPALDLDGLIYGTLISYPMYHLPYGKGLATPEDVVDYLYNESATVKQPIIHQFFHQIKRAVKTKAMQLRKLIWR